MPIRVSGRKVWDRTTPIGAGLMLRVMKPTTANVGAGIIRPTPTRVLTSADTSFGTWSAGVLTLNKDLRDCIVKGTVKVGAANLLIENNIIQGDVANPPTGSRYVIDTSGFTGTTTVRYNTISPVVRSQYFNAVGPRNVVAEFNDISHVTDGFVPSQAAGVPNVAMTIRGNHVHDFQFYAPDPTHAATPLTTAGGVTITGPWAGQPWNHCDAVQVEVAGTTGLNIYGNNFVATWANDSIGVTPLPNAIKQLSCFMLNAGTNLVIEDNWLDGGEYCVNNGATAVTGVFRRNRFGRRMATTGTADSTYFALMLSSTGLQSFDSTADRNVWEDTGLQVARRGS